ncbi:sigma-70 family RNA polymerase sigma factor [Lysinibacillus cavernae]|uniref:sigma-70 family RNA polymerase sigma factor n=1 Tax=Lysinibacillus cavernae TaxID=2666135 RepID=UPI0012D876B1|nr:sigma-70 family RNA polymerase sigma factor [Lysinibacillus cavernae]
MTIQNDQKRSSTQSFDELLESVQPMITSILKQLRIYKDFDYYRHIASIAVWNAWLKADPAKGQFSAYIYSTIKGDILNELSKEKKYTERMTVVDNETLNYVRELEEVENQKSNNILESILPQLKQEERNILLLYYVEGYSDQEIAKVLGLSVTASKKRRYRITKKLRNQISKEE